jgi:hypothetical protein
MKTLVAYIDGGLGNRMGTLIGAMFLETYLNRKLIINWPINNWCGCNFNSLFDNDIEKTEMNLPVFLEKYNTCNFVTHEMQHNFSGYQLHPSILSNINYINKYIEQENTILYNNNSILDFMSKENVLIQLNNLKIKSNILQYVKDFCKDNKIDKNVIGIHIRKTDGGLHNINEDIFKQNIINNKHQKYFICSDDKETELFYKNYENVIIHNKKYYVEKFNKNDDWNSTVTDINGKEYPFNVNRSEESVIEAFLDLLILSRTTLLKNGVNIGSTFLKFSDLYSNLNL